MSNYPPTPSYEGPHSFNAQYAGTQTAHPSMLNQNGYQPPQQGGFPQHPYAIQTPPTYGNMYSFQGNSHMPHIPVPTNPPPPISSFGTLANGGVLPPAYTAPAMLHLGGASLESPTVHQNGFRPSVVHPDTSLPPKPPPLSDPVAVNVDSVHSLAIGSIGKEDGELSDGEMSASGEKVQSFAHYSPSEDYVNDRDNVPDPGFRKASLSGRVFEPQHIRTHESNDRSQFIEAHSWNSTKSPKAHDSVTGNKVPNGASFLSNKPLTPQGNSGPINISKSRHPQMARNTDSHEYFPHHESQAKRFAPFSKPFDDRRLDTTRQRARQTLQELISHKIGFNQLVTENIDSALLKELYSEIGVDVPVTSPSSSMAHTSIQDNGVKSPKTLKKRNEDTIGSDNSLGNLELPNASMVSNDTREHSIQQAVDQQPESQHRPSKPLTPDKNILVDTIPKPAKAITSRPQATAPQGNSPFQKPSALPPSDKALERKDYIARMLAARAGKSVSATKSPKQSSNPRTEIGKGNAPKSASAKVFDTSVSPEQAASSPHTMEVDLESKKKAQTELALQKIEALKTRKANEERANQATVSHSQVTSSQAATPAASPQVNSITLELTSASKQYQTTVMPETAGDPSTTVPFSRISPPPSLFSPFGKKAMFGIPGLFMSSAQPVSVPQVTQSPSLQTTITSVPPSLGQHPPSFTTPPMRSPLVAASNVPINASPPQTLPPSGQADTASPDAEPFSGSRKRARAVDFIDSLSDRVNKRLDSGKDTEVFIGDSDDEETETIENGATEFKTSPKPAKPFESVNGSRDQPKPIRDLPPLSDFPPKPKPGAKATLQTPPIVQVPVKDKDKEDLKQKEQEIQLMQRKIQELEQRRKAKQTASRAETPVQQGVVAPQTAPQSSALRQSKSSDKTEEPLQAVDRYLELQKASLAISEVVIQDQLDELDVRKQAKANEIAKAEAENVTARNAITVAEMELRQRRKADIEAGLPQLDAQVERTRLRLEILRNQIEELESDMQKGLKGRQDLLEELQTLDEVQEDVVDYKEHLVTQGPHTSESSHLAESSTLGEKLETESPSITGKHLSPSQSAQSISANRVDLADTETVHSVMSISSNSTDDGEITDCNPQSLVHSQASPDVNSLQEDHIQDLDTGISPSQETFTRNLQPSINDLAGRVDESVLPNSVESTMIMGNRASHTPEDLQGYGKSPEVDAMQEEGEASSGLFPSDASDSDDYEPPDPVSPMNDEAVFSESEPFSPKSPTPPAGIALKASKTAKPVPLVKSPVDDMDEETTTRQYSAPEMKAEKASTVGRAMIGDHFIPYESPLKHFKSYRYHPDYLSETSGGFRSLTYSHNIKPREPLCRWELAGGTCNDDSCDSQHFRSMGLSDDMILVQLGSVHEGSTPEARDSFVGGLKKIIQEMRGRKVRDFNTVASEITAYRANFLNDRSRILVL